MGLYTLDTILNRKLDKWDGSNLWSTPLAAASCTDAGGFLESRRLIKDSIAASDSSIEDDDDEHIISEEESIESRINNFEVCMFWSREQWWLMTNDCNAISICSNFGFRLVYDSQPDSTGALTSKEEKSKVKTALGVFLSLSLYFFFPPWIWFFFKKRKATKRRLQNGHRHYPFPIPSHTKLLTSNNSNVR